MTIERFGDVAFKGNPLTVIGNLLVVGSAVPDFKLVATDLHEVFLTDFSNKVCLLSVVFSLDMGVCDVQTRRFYEETAVFQDKVIFLTISADLPFAQARWCREAGFSNMHLLSDHRDMCFGNAFGTHIKELRLEQRAVFVINTLGEIVYVEYVPEIAQHPDYDAAITAVKRNIEGL